MRVRKRGRRSEYGGMNWVRPEKRLALYDRDGRSCVWCSAENERLTLDHVKPFSRGGTNDASNLVTACKPCNSARGAMSVERFARRVAGRAKAASVLARVREALGRPLDVEAAKAAIAAAGGFSRALGVA